MSPGLTTTNLPAEVRDLALRLGARPDSTLSSVSLTQIGTMRHRVAALARGITPAHARHFSFGDHSCRRRTEPLRLQWRLFIPIRTSKTTPAEYYKSLRDYFDLPRNGNITSHFVRIYNFVYPGQYLEGPGGFCGGRNAVSFTVIVN
jgi:hypothetical protein